MFQGTCCSDGRSIVFEVNFIRIYCVKIIGILNVDSFFKIIFQTILISKKNHPNSDKTPHKDITIPSEKNYENYLFKIHHGEAYKVFGDENIKQLEINAVYANCAYLS